MIIIIIIIIKECGKKVSFSIILGRAQNIVRLNIIKKKIIPLPLFSKYNIHLSTKDKHNVTTSYLYLTIRVQFS